VEETKIAILGAGITGLCIAQALHESGENFEIIETSDKVGGALQSTLRDGFLAEHGPNSLLLKDRRVLSLLEDIGLRNQAIQDTRSEAEKRFIVDQGVLHPLPESPFKMIRSPLFTFGGILRLAREPFISRYKSRKEESFADFVKRRLGQEMFANAAGPFVSGIYAGDPAKLAIRHAFPRLWKLENEHRSLILGSLSMRRNKHKNIHALRPTRTISPQCGMGALPKALAQNLPKRSIHLASKVESIRPWENGWQIRRTDSTGQMLVSRHSQLVIAVPHHRLSTLPLPNDILQKLAPVSSIETPPVTSLVLGFKREQIEHQLDGFGMLIKEAEKSPLLGVLFSSSMFEGRAPKNHVTLTCMMGGVKHPEYAENSDTIVLQELKRLLGVKGSPVFRHRTSWENAIPQYGLDYQTVLDALDSCENNHPSIHFAGNYRNGISVTDCILNGLQLGKHLSAIPQKA